MDVANNWLGGARHGVKLTQQEMDAIQQLPWFDRWLNKLSTRRFKKQCKENTLIEPYTVDVDAYDSLANDIMQEDSEDENCIQPESQPMF